MGFHKFFAWFQLIYCSIKNPSDTILETTKLMVCFFIVFKCFANFDRTSDHLQMNAMQWLMVHPPALRWNLMNWPQGGAPELKTWFVNPIEDWSHNRVAPTYLRQMIATRVVYWTFWPTQFCRSHEILCSSIFNTYLSENSLPLNPMVKITIVPLKWLQLEVWYTHLHPFPNTHIEPCPAARMP